MNSCEEFQLNNNFNNQPSTEKTNKILTTKILVDNDYKDKLYFQTANNLLECKFCYYKNTGIHMVRHYKEQHNEEEVLPSRLSKECAEILINESLKENYGYRNFEDSKLSLNGPVNFCYTCVFCQIIFEDFTKFYDHITSHTGEYRYNCQVCNKTYPNKNELYIHNLKQDIYLNDEYINKLYPDLIQSNRLFGYLCSFCYYVQLSYSKIEKHMSSRHLNEDKKSNNYWTVICISMSTENTDYDNTTINYTNLVGCLPPTEDYKYKQLSVNTESKENKVSDEQKFNKYLLESKQTSLSSLCECRMDKDSNGIDYIEYTFKDNIKKCTIAKDLTCELIVNSMLLYKCSVSRCTLNKFSTVILMDFYKHIELNHQHVIWDKSCNICDHKIENIEEEYFLKDAIKHLVTKHLVLKKSDIPNVYLKKNQSFTTASQEILQNTILEQKPGDILSINTENKNVEEIVIENNEQPNNFIFNGLFEESDGQPNINYLTTTDLNLPILDPPIDDVISLKKDVTKYRKVQKVVDNGLVNVINLPHGISSLPEIVSTKSKERCLEFPNVLSSTQVNDNNQSLDSIVITIPNRTQMENYTFSTQSIDNEFIILDDTNQTDVQETSKIIDYTKIMNNDNTEIPKKRKLLSKNAIDESKKSKQLDQSLISMNELFTCKECDHTFCNGDQLNNHVRNGCLFLSNTNSQTESPKSENIENKQIKLLFSPDTIKSIPTLHIFTEPIGCLLCAYTTKVRSNLINHMNRHKNGTYNISKEIVNPVPSIGESGPMFTKMDNLSASSFEAKKSEKMKIDEIILKIVEKFPSKNSLNLELFPKFIPTDKRYKCSILHCTFMGKTYDMLKEHILIHHPVYQSYKCPHCKPESETKIIGLKNIEFHLMCHSKNLYKCQYCDYIDFNKNEMKIHMRNVHLLQITTSQSNIIIIRKLILHDTIINKHEYQQDQVSGAQWICNMCYSDNIYYTESEIKLHIKSAHGISNKFKCPMCTFDHYKDDVKIFVDHYKLKHPTVAVKYVQVFESITNKNKELCTQNASQPKSTSNIQEFQALNSIDPKFAPPACRGIPVTRKSYNKSCNVRGRKG